MHFTKAFLIGIVAFATSALASPEPARRITQGRLTRGRISVGGSPWKPKDGPYNINEKIGFFHHDFSTNTYGYKGPTYPKRKLDGVEIVIEKACTVLMNGGETRRFQGGMKQMARELLPAGGILVANFQFHSPAPVDVSKKECVRELTNIQLYYGFGGTGQRYSQGGWGYVADGNCKVELLFQ